MRRNTMRSRFLLGAATLLAGITLASAQGMREGGGAGGSPGGASAPSAGGGDRGMSSGPTGSQSPGSSEIHRGGESMKGGQSGERPADRGGQAQRDRMQQDRTTGQGSREGAQSAPEPKAGQSQRQPDSGQAQRERGRKNQSTGKERDRTTGQGSHDSAQPAPEQKAQPKQQPQQQTQQPQRQQGTTGSGTATQQQSQPSGTATQSQSGVTLDAQKQASIQQSVLSARNAPRVSSVNFAVSTGTVVPSSVHFVSISTFPILIETFPQYRDYSFFVVEDEIVILEPRSRKIVEVVPVGPRRASSRGGSTTVTSTETLQLSEPEIREVQLVLVQRGLLAQADVTGVLNERTKTALTTFQRQQGLQTSGSIDVRTVSALGLQSKVGPQRTGASGSSTTTGQGASSGASSTQQPSAQQGQTGTQQPSAQQNTSGQGVASRARRDKPRRQQAMVVRARNSPTCNRDRVINPAAISRLRQRVRVVRNSLRRIRKIRTRKTIRVAQRQAVRMTPLSTPLLSPASAGLSFCDDTPCRHTADFSSPCRGEVRA